MIRRDIFISDHISELKLDLDELKTAQFTSQDSGMRFYDVSPGRRTFTAPATTSYESKILIYHKFTGRLGKPTLVSRAIGISIDGATLEVDERSNGQRYYFSSPTIYYGEWRPYATKRKCADYQDFQLSVIYYNASSPFTISINTSTQATDRGSDAITYEVIP